MYIIVTIFMMMTTKKLLSSSLFNIIVGKVLERVDGWDVINKDKYYI